MTGAESLIAAFIGGVLTSASPCVLAAVPVAVGYVGGQTTTPRRAWALALAFVAGLNVALLIMGLLAARLGMLLGTLPGLWSAAVGVIIIAAAIWIWRREGAGSVRLLPALEKRLATSGLSGAFVLGALIGTVMSPCATPALAAALAIAGAGNTFGNSMWWGATLLLVYGVGHSVLLLIVGAIPSAAATLIRQVASMQAWLPGRRVFAIILAVAGLWWLAQGAGLFT